MTCRKTKLIGVRERVVLRSLPWLIFLLFLASSGWGSTLYKDSVRAANDDAQFRASNTTIYNGAGNNLIFGNDGASKVSGMRWLNVTIPVGSTIDSAWMQIRSNETSEPNDVDLIIDGEDTADAATFSTYADGAARIRTTAHVYWDNVATWTSGTYYQSPDIKTVIEEIVHREDWASGNDMVIFIADNASADYRRSRQYEDNATTTNRLLIYWTAHQSASSGSRRRMLLGGDN